ncbi:twin-arginine translocation signal domain-containing protein, partial [Marinobacterium sp. D7]|uniref:twin-arginine translocation signal domain-containing protein n=1 Tax=Marinobacterium ramblicola TaxID=2849041 RepID=UPI001C2D98BF
MKNKKQPFDRIGSQMGETGIESVHGISRRDLMRGIAAGTLLAATGGSLLAGASSVYAQSQTPQRGGRIKVATAAGSTADTLDPARGSNYTDYCRLFMFYNGLTT